MVGDMPARNPQADAMLLLGCIHCTSKTFRAQFLNNEFWRFGHQCITLKRLIHKQHKLFIFCTKLKCVDFWFGVTLFAESLDILICTLDQASFDQGHIQGLFFLAETALYWLRTDAINSPYLRISEIKLLKVCMHYFWWCACQADQ